MIYHKLSKKRQDYVYGKLELDSTRQKLKDNLWCENKGNKNGYSWIARY